MRKKIGFKDSKAFGVGSLMPRGLKHWPDKDQPFDPRESEVIRWLISQPEILKYLAMKFTSGAIIFDHTTETWRGINSNSNAGN